MPPIFTFFGAVFIIALSFIAGYYMGKSSVTSNLMDKYYLIPQDKGEFRILLKQLRQMYSEIRRNNSKLNQSAQKIVEKKQKW